MSIGQSEAPAKKPRRAGKLRGTQVTSFPEGPANAAEMPGYGFYVNTVSTNIEHFGGAINMEADLNLKTYYNDGKTGTEQMANLERFLKDIETLNKITGSKHPGVIEQWEQLQTLLTLIDEEDK